MADGKDLKPHFKAIAVKTETDTGKASTSPMMRLPTSTFRPPRDLHLGANSTRSAMLAPGGNKNTRKYVPNINVQRSKIKEEVKVKEEAPKPMSPSKGRGRGNAERGQRGRGRGANLVQQTSGVFSEGIALRERPGSHRDSESGKPDAFIPKPKLNLKQNYSSDSKEEGERLKQLLQDDFIDDPDALSNELKPLQLPMIPLKKVKKPVKIENPDIKPIPKDDNSTVFDRHVQDVLISREQEYVLIQLPDCLPGMRPTVEPENSKNGTNSNVSQEPSSVDTSQPQCTLASLPEGLMGKIQLLRSGRAQLQFGAVTLPISMGTQVSFRQDLLSVNLNDVHKSGSMVNLGQVRTRLVVTPDWETMLRKV